MIATGLKKESFYLRIMLVAMSLYTHNPQNRSDLTMWFDDAVAATSYIGPKAD